jgi:hypothetical protein
MSERLDASKEEILRLKKERKLLNRVIRERDDMVKKFRPADTENDPPLPPTPRIC